LDKNCLFVSYKLETVLFHCARSAVVIDFTDNALVLNENRTTACVPAVVKPGEETKGLGNNKKELPTDERGETDIANSVSKIKVET
jgi:hypothetical protein